MTRADSPENTTDQAQRQQSGDPEPGLSDPCGMLTRMNEDIFWQLIEDCRPAETDRIPRSLQPR